MRTENIINNNMNSEQLYLFEFVYGNFDSDNMFKSNIVSDLILAQLENKNANEVIAFAIASIGSKLEEVEKMPVEFVNRILSTPYGMHYLATYNVFKNIVNEDALAQLRKEINSCHEKYMGKVNKNFKKYKNATNSYFIPDDYEITDTVDIHTPQAKANIDGYPCDANVYLGKLIKYILYATTFSQDVKRFRMTATHKFSNENGNFIDVDFEELWWNTIKPL